MRTIKFKYLVKRENGHIFSNIFFLDQIELGAFKMWKDINHINDEDIIRLQFTGLLNKNGKEIYEGDIITAKIQEFPKLKPIFKVVYEEYDTAFSAFDIKNKCWVKLNAMEYEIIGNIYENKSLLND